MVGVIAGCAKWNRYLAIVVGGIASGHNKMVLLQFPKIQEIKWVLLQTMDKLGHLQVAILHSRVACNFL